MRIIGYVSHREHVSGRYRLAAFRPFLESAGHSLELRPFPRFWPTWWSTEPRADLVVIQRRLLSPARLTSFRKRAGCLLYDFDDALFFRDSYDRRGLFCEKRMRGFVSTVQNVDGVIAGNRFLLQQAALHRSPEKTTRIPTCVDPDRYRLANHRHALPVRLVWIGSSSTLEGLHRIAPLLDQLGRRIPGLSLRIICDRSLTLNHLPVEFIPWSQAGEAEALAESDIGISWLPNDLWSEGKCGLKVLQYMAAGLPVVANPVGPHAELVRPGESGFWAETEEQWVESIQTLAQSVRLRLAMGQAGRQRVEAEYHVKHGARAWLKMLERLRSSRPLAESRSI